MGRSTQGRGNFRLSRVEREKLTAMSPAVLVFSPGCMFGLGVMFKCQSWNCIRCGLHLPAVLYVLRHSAVAEASTGQPEMCIALRNAVANAFVHQVKIQAPEKNAEVQRR